MTCEELKVFRETVAEPKMAKLLANAKTPDFLRCIAKMRIEVLDCRSCGKDYRVIANGFTCRDGKVFAETLCDLAFDEEEAKEQMEWLQECAFLKEGTVTVRNELEEATLEVKFYNAGKYLSLFPALSFLAATPMWVQSEYLPILEAIAEPAENGEETKDDGCALVRPVGETLEALANKMLVEEISLRGAELHCKCKVSTKDTKTFIFGLSPNGSLRCRESADLLWHPVRENIESVRAGDFYLIDQCIGVEIHNAWFDAKEEYLEFLKAREYMVASFVTGEVFTKKDFRPEAVQIIRKLLKNISK